VRLLPVVEEETPFRNTGMVVGPKGPEADEVQQITGLLIMQLTALSNHLWKSVEAVIRSFMWNCLSALPRSLKRRRSFRDLFQYTSNALG
jgi:hypothetical protein